MHRDCQFQCFVRQMLVQTDMAASVRMTGPVEERQQVCHNQEQVLCSYGNLNLLGCFAKDEIILSSFKIQVDSFPDIFQCFILRVAFTDTAGKAWYIDRIPPFLTGLEHYTQVSYPNVSIRGMYT